MWNKIDRWLARISNYLFFNPFMKKIKQKKCKDCIYKYEKGVIFACYKTKHYIEPLKLICFRKKCDKTHESY